MENSNCPLTSLSLEKSSNLAKQPFGVMTRSANILGFAFLAVAATMTAMITMRNSPQPVRRDRPSIQMKVPRGRVSAGRFVMQDERPPTRLTEHKLWAQQPRIDFDKQWLDSLTAVEREEWLQRAAAVEHAANVQLDRLTAQLDLTQSQRVRLFPALARSATGFDPVMMIGGVPGYPREGLTPADEVHSLLDPDQQLAVEEADVNRQLWWQTIIDRLEADLNDQTGGVILGGETVPATAEPVAPAAEREAPAARDSASLFDMLNR